MAKDTLPTTLAELKTEEQKVRAELQSKRLDHSLQKLGSTATLRTLRTRLARILTMQTIVAAAPATPPSVKKKTPEKK